MKFLLIIAGIALTALCWGSYGPVLHTGQHHLGGDKFKPLICVGAAYFIVAIIVPTLILSSQGRLSGDWSMSGITWSMAAGTAGALGALGIILALTSGGKPWFVMPLVFGFAPVVTTFISIYSNNLWDKASPIFYAGLIMVVAGAVTVLVFAPKDQPHKPEAETAKVTEQKPSEQTPKAVESNEEDQTEEK